jgi:hypothetical protein
MLTQKASIVVQLTFCVLINPVQSHPIAPRVKNALRVLAVAAASARALAFAKSMRRETANLLRSQAFGTPPWIVDNRVP